MEDRLGLHIFFKFLALKYISLRTFICLEVYFLPMPPGLELTNEKFKAEKITVLTTKNMYKKIHNTLAK